MNTVIAANLVIIMLCKSFKVKISFLRQENQTLTAGSNRVNKNEVSYIF